MDGQTCKTIAVVLYLLTITFSSETGLLWSVSVLLSETPQHDLRACPLRAPQVNKIQTVTLDFI